jgi:hypothetical protein
MLVDLLWIQLFILLKTPVHFSWRKRVHRIVSVGFWVQIVAYPAIVPLGVQAGAIFVDAAARKYLHNTLQTAGLAREDVEEYVARGVKDFESNAKRAFRDATVDQSIEIAGTRFNNVDIRTRRGRMNVSGYDFRGSVIWF